MMIKHKGCCAGEVGGGTFCASMAAYVRREHYTSVLRITELSIGSLVPLISVPPTSVALLMHVLFMSPKTSSYTLGSLCHSKFRVMALFLSEGHILQDSSS